MKLYELLTEDSEFINVTGKYSPFASKPVARYREGTRELRALDNTQAAEIPAGVPLPPKFPKKKKKKNKKKSRWMGVK
jgi:hypothetical protein